MNLRIPDWLTHYLEKPVAVLGAGKSGLAAVKLVSKLGGEAILYDENPELGYPSVFERRTADKHGLVVYSPGFSAAHEWLIEAEAQGCECVAEIDLAAVLWPGKIYAVTGTNGKTTLVELMAHALSHAGVDAYAVGNVGYPFSEVYEQNISSDTVAVCEVSSFQAEALNYMCPTATMWTSFSEDHLDRHVDMDSYFRAKYNVVERTPMECVLFDESSFLNAQNLGFDVSEDNLVKGRPEDLSMERIEGTPFIWMPQYKNLLMAKRFWERLELPLDTFWEAVQSFEISSHRLKLVETRQGINFWNDSKATNFHAVEMAMSNFDRPVIWVGGGRAKGGDLEAFIHRIVPYIKKAYVMGEVGEPLAKMLENEQREVTICSSMDDAVQAAVGAASEGDNILFSPGFSSFDMFADYVDRGNQFEAEVLV